MRSLISGILVFLFSLSLFSCKGDDNATEPYNIVSGHMMLAINEGNFRSGNASVDLYNLGSGRWLDYAFKSLNNRALGDVCQSAAFWNGQGFLVLNNSAKIEVLNPSDFKSVLTINGFTSPRYLLPVSSAKAYVSDLYANKVWILSGTPLSITGHIPVIGWTEEMVLVNGKVWVVNKSRPVIQILDPVSDLLVDSLQLPGKPTSIAKGSGDFVWVGVDSAKGQTPKINLINGVTKTIEKTIHSPFSVQTPDRFVSSATGDSLFYIHGGPCMYDRTTAILTRFNNEPGNWYGIGFDPIFRVVVASDVKDYQQKSRIWMKYLDSGVQVEKKGGLITSHFYFF